MYKSHTLSPLMKLPEDVRVSYRYTAGGIDRVCKSLIEEIEGREEQTIIGLDAEWKMGKKCGDRCDVVQVAFIADDGDTQVFVFHTGQLQPPNGDDGLPRRLGKLKNLLEHDKVQARSPHKRHHGLLIT
jgi:hypothetical protein